MAIEYRVFLPREQQLCATSTIQMCVYKDVCLLCGMQGGVYEEEELYAFSPHHLLHCFQDYECYVVRIPHHV